ncbi:MAG TPA: response regulator [Leptolyngbyaceae cyanobacterium M33_DOE_097]|uniref:Response regulator n=1 Tax=Oscillatoriales cyanobacterium SpSt-418 TaxID=2282169 RepID=A0A7C3KEC0_9CYAN|nr:response regulator [Leptolyngbyaceae cyanobacterium M33_DOE_097]
MLATHINSNSLDETRSDQQTALIMIVDDEKATRLVLRRAMEREGYQTIDADSGEHCLSLCQKLLPDMILLDAVMPGMGGFSCCNQLKITFGELCPPILMITTLYDKESIDSAFAAGASDFITKPTQWTILRQRVQRLLANHQIDTQLKASLAREYLLKEQLETAVQKITYLINIVQSNGIDISL